MLDDALAAADSLLGADDSTATKTEADPPPKFLRDQPLSDPDAGGAAGLDTANTLDDASFDWIHFGRVHRDQGAHFIHDELNDLLAAADLDPAETGRASELRAATLRETLLLHEQMVGTQRVLTDFETQKGGVAGMMDMASDLLLGEPEAGAEPPAAAEVQLHLDALTASGGLANQAKIKALDLHTTGRDLHLFRADFRAFCEKCVEAFVTGDGDNSGDGGLGGLLPDMPAIGGVMGTVQKIVFKAFDLYVALHFRLREAYEPRIDDALHAATLEALGEGRRPIYPTWFPAPPPVSAPTPPSGPGAPSNPIESAVADVKDKVDDVKDTVGDAVDDVKDFLGFEEDPPTAPGLAALDAIFADFSGGDPKAPPSGTPNPNAAQIMVDAFGEVVADIVPDFLATIIVEVQSANVRLLQRVYRAILFGRASKPITADAMIRAGREELAETLVRLALELIPGLGFLADENREFLSAGGMSFGNEELHNLAERYLDQGLGAQIGKIAELSSAALAPLLEEARQIGGAEARTMEPFLGRLPYLVSLQFRNTFFPLVDLVLNAVFGAAGGPLAAITSKVGDLLGDAGSAYQDAMETKEKVEHAKDKLADGVDLLDAAKDPNAFVDDLLGNDGPAGGPGGPSAPPPFPGNDRVNLGEGVRITADDAKEIKAQQREIDIVRP